ncbi:MAG: ADP-ribosylglycohydrolase family protein [Sinobacteraceae bacterium]|nr:ADP-ribosylglycohydrolase family protein [Nevskiaceae bacterium]MCP5466083.1 ADP-ribosylglycohydrolase family protein [Nevskiaceae bacterium]
MKFLRRLAGVDSGPSRPLANTYWVLPGQLLAGEYPGSPDDEERVERLARLVAAGIDSFFDLTAAGEREAYAAALPAGVEYQRLPIEDHGLPQSAEYMAEIVAALGAALAAGRRPYVHCRAGIGRTGMVVACHLIASGRTPEDALAELNRLWKQCGRSADWRRVPETEEQRDFVLDQGAAVAQFAAAAVSPLPEDAALGAAQRLRSRFQGALTGLAVGDALAAPTQMLKRGTFAPVHDMIGGGNYDLLPGAWTDDTAMALCLAESLIEHRDFDPHDQVARYTAWQQQGYMSASGQCVGITASVSRALAAAKWRRQAFAGSHDPTQLDPEPLARVAPVVMFWFADVQATVARAADAARITCQAPEVLAACRLLAAMLHGALSGQSKAQLLQPAAVAALRPSGANRLAAIAAGSYRSKTPETLRPAGDALDLLEAALWALFAHSTFRDGALAVANLGGASDVIGAIHGQLAGAHYGLRAIPLAWRHSLAQAGMIEGLADRLLAEAMVGLGRLT